MIRLLGWFAGGYLVVRALSREPRPPSSPRPPLDGLSRFLWKLTLAAAGFALLVGLLNAVSR